MQHCSIAKSQDGGSGNGAEVNVVTNFDACLVGNIFFECSNCTQCTLNLQSKDMKKHELHVREDQNISPLKALALSFSY